MLHELRIALERIDHLQRLMPGLLDRIGHALGHAVRHDHPVTAAGLLNGVQEQWLSLNRRLSIECLLDELCHVGD
jgi:hypothetical protein